MSSRIDAPEGTVVTLRDRAGRMVGYGVRGRKDWHKVSADGARCSCMDFMHRRSRGLTPCRHMRFLQTWLLIAQMVELEFDRRDREAVEERAPLPSDEELRRIFA